MKGTKNSEYTLTQRVDSMTLRMNHQNTFIEPLGALMHLCVLIMSSEQYPEICQDNRFQLDIIWIP